MEAFFRSGAVAWLLWAVLAIEAVALIAARRRARVVLGAVLPGVFFVAALWAALTEREWWWMGAALAAAGVAHAADLRRGGLVGRG